MTRQWPAVVAALVVMVCETACTVVLASDSSANASLGVTTEHAGPESTEYVLDTARSSVSIFVYRGGTLGRLGHNHVIVANQLAGAVQMHDNLGNSTVAFTIPLEHFAVDGAEERAKAGSGFESTPSDKDVAGTRRNMFGPKLLDAVNFPNIQVTGRDFRETESGQSIEVSFLIKEHRLTKRIPIELIQEEDRVAASGEVELTHGELGLRPFRVMLGALRVRDTLRVKFSLVAAREPG